MPRLEDEVSYLATSGLSDADLARATGAAASTARVWLRRGSTPTGERAERLIELVAVVERLEGVLERDEISVWLRKPLPTLDDDKPLDVLGRGGYREVTAVIAELTPRISSQFGAQAKGRPPSRATTRETIAETAMRIVDHEGPDALSMRRLGDELGMPPTTIYSYIPTKDEVLDEVCAIALGQFTTREIAPGPWGQRAQALVTDLYTGMQEHPGVSELIMRRPPPVQALDRFRERMLGILKEGGFSDEQAIHAQAALFSYALGHALGRRRRGDDFTAREAARLRELPPDEFPLLARVADAYSMHMSENGFRIGLGALLLGLRTMSNLGAVVDP